MALEDLTGTDKFIDDLDKNNPVGSEDFLEGADNHLRGIKNVLLNTFLNITGQVTATQAELNALAGLAAVIDSFLGAATAEAARSVIGAKATDEIQDPSSGTTSDDNFTTVKNNFLGTAAPSVSADSSAGYSVGSLWWVNTAGVANSGSMYVCRDATVGAAVWRKIATRTSEQSGAPGATHDRNSRYSRGAIIVDTDGPTAHICTNNAAGAATWVAIGGEWEPVSATAIGAGTELEILDFGAVGYDSRIRVEGFTNGTGDAALAIRTSADASSPTWDQASGNYQGTANGMLASAGENNDFWDSQLYHQPAGSFSVGSNFSADMELVILDPYSTSRSEKSFLGNIVGTANSGASWHNVLMMTRAGSSAAIKSVQLYWVGGQSFTAVGKVYVERRLRR